ncbi:5' nucleotidase, NT5C type [Sporosalibacterium faouarense]|uniref:5' nucleotidase, NT5C type n=1 Tax=Sporosalibacterium faouarense TaxID=516123 RepID=UPI00141D118D|nr:hypothetical protein [Sporosalibacterium faouarense]MTI46458.1 hypothetical protein [Bacillota bacterium]
MTGLNICIDIDGTITEPYCWIDIANEYFKVNLQPEDVTEYEIHKVLNIPREDYLKFYEKWGKEVHRRATIRENAYEILHKIHDEHNIYYVTAREEKMTEITKDWLVEKRLPQAQLFLLGSHYKVDKAKDLGCHVFIEDRYENALQLSMAGYKVLLIDCYYNRYPIMPGMTRVRNWKEIFREINRYASTLVQNKNCQGIA